MFKAVGAIPIVLSTAPEIYIGLSQNMVSGIDLPVIAYVSSKSNEVTKNICMTNHVYNAGMLMMSKAKMNSLHPKHQTVIWVLPLKFSRSGASWSPTRPTTTLGTASEGD